MKNMKDSAIESDVFNSVPLPCLLLNVDAPHFTIYSVNDAYLEAINSKRSDLVGQSLFEALPVRPAEVEGSGVSNLLRSLELVLIKGEKDRMPVEKYDIPIRGTAQFEVRYWEPENTPIKGSDGAIHFILHSLTDVTEKLVLTEEKENTKGQFQSMMQSVDGIFWEADAESFAFTYVSPQVKSILGYTPEEWIAEREFWQNHLHPEDREQAIEFCHSNTMDGKDHQFDYRMITANGTSKWLHDIVTVVKENGRAKLLRGVMVDMTERKAGEQLRKLLETTVAKTNDAILITKAEPLDGPDGPEIIYVNDAFTRLTGWEASEAIGKTPRILQGPKTDRAVLDQLGDNLRKWKASDVDLINYTKDGREFWINLSIAPVADENGWFTHWISIERDITERKQAEIKKILLADISNLFNQPAGLSEIMEAVIKRIWNDSDYALCETWLIRPGYKEIELFAKHFSGGAGETFYTHANMTYHFENGKGFPGYAWARAGMAFWNEGDNAPYFTRKETAVVAGIKTMVGVPLLYQGVVIGVLIGGFDEKVKEGHPSVQLFVEIAGQLAAEIKRKQLETELKQIFNTAPDIICLADFDGRFKRMNEAGCRLLEYSEEELLQKPYHEMVHPDDLMISANEVQKLAEGETTFHFENRYVSKSGKIIWLDWSCTSVVEERIIYAVARDITDKKELQEILDRATNLALIGGWEIDVAKETVYWSDVTRKIHEVEDDSFELGVASGISFYKEGWSRDEIYKAVARGIEEGEKWDIELIIVTAKGNERWVRVIGEPEMRDGKCVRILGSFQDIHQRKTAEIELQHAYEERNNILESIGDAFFAMDRNFIVAYWNKKAEELVYTKREDIVGKGLWDYFPEAVELPSFKFYHQALETNETVVFEDFFANKQLEVHAYPSEKGLSVFFKDITERKHAEEALRRSNERFEIVTRATNDAIWDWDITNDVLYRSANADLLFGYEVDKLKSSKDFWTDRFHTVDVEAIKESVMAAVTDPACDYWEMEYRIKRKDGTIAFVIDRGRIIRDARGKATRMAGAITDITYRKEAEDALKRMNALLQAQALELAESNERFEKVTEATNDAIWDYNVLRNELFWGKGFKTIFGYDADDNKPTFAFLLSCIHADDREHVAARIKQYMKDSSLNNWFEEYRFMRADGTHAYVIDRATFIRDAGGKVIRVVGAMTDISYRKEFEESLRQLNAALDVRARELAVSNADLEQFAYIASHDLQEPLRMVTSFLTQVEKRYSSLLDEKGKQYIHFAVDGAKRMRQIILDLLEYSRVGRVGFIPEEIDLNELITELRFLFKREMEEKGALITSEVLPIISGHRSPLRQLFQNLLSNALKYSTAGRTPEIHISVSETEGYWQFSVRDNGIGIEKEYFERIFIIFQRLHNKDEYSGTGMGLSISKKIVESFGGKLWLESTVDKGSTFYFTLTKAVNDDS